MIFERKIHIAVKQVGLSGTRFGCSEAGGVEGTVRKEPGLKHTASLCRVAMALIFIYIYIFCHVVISWEVNSSQLKSILGGWAVVRSFAKHRARAFSWPVPGIAGWVHVGGGLVDPFGNPTSKVSPWCQACAIGAYLYLHDGSEHKKEGVPVQSGTNWRAIAG